MRMTPLEIQSHQFSQRRRGFDRDEVEAFLQMVTEDYEALVMESAEQRECNRQLEEQLEAAKSQENLLRETLISAQSISDQMRAATEKECQARLSQAEVQAQATLEASQREVARLAENIRELQGMRTRMAESLRTTIRTQLGWVDQLMAQPDPIVRSPQPPETTPTPQPPSDKVTPEPSTCTRARGVPAAPGADRLS